MEHRTHQDSRELVEDGLYTIRQSAEFLQLSRSRIYELLTEGILPSVRIGRSRRIPKRALLELAARELSGGVR